MTAPVHLDSPEATVAAGVALADRIRSCRIDSLVIHLIGDLGAGKTTFARGFLRGLGHEDRVPSPTYTLIEPYSVAGYSVTHIDLYRVKSADEAETLALAELGGGGTLMLIEWPENGGDRVPPADLRVELGLEPDGEGRVMRLVGSSAVGKSLV